MPSAAPSPTVQRVHERLLAHGLRRHARIGEQPGYAEIVLLCQHLGRRHDGTLVAAFDPGEEGGDGDDRFSRSDLALEETVHRLGLLQVPMDVGQHPLLSCRQAVRQAVEEPLCQ